MSEALSVDAPTLLRYLLANLRGFRMGVAMAILRCLIIAPCPWLFQLIIDDHVKAGNVRGIVAMALIFTGLLLLHYAFSVQGSVLIAREMARLMLSLRSAIFNKLHFLHFGYLDRQKSGRLLSKYAFDTQKIEGALMQFLNQFLPNILYSLSITIILVALHWQLSAVLLLMIPTFALLRRLFYARIKQSNEDSRIAQEQLTGTASEVISALRLVRSLGQERQVTNEMDLRSEDLARSKLELTSVSSIFGTFTYMTTQFLSLLTVATGAYFVIAGTMSVGTLLAFMAGLPIIMMPMYLFANIGEQYFIGQEAYRSLKELLDSEYVEEWSGQRKLEPLLGEVQFDHASFGYPGAERAVLEDFSLHIRPGEHVALVGHSGAGKSTITYLILGLYRTHRGQVLIDGVPQSELDMRWFRRQCAVVLQENLLLSGTIAENIRFARPDATDEEVRSAARLANAEEFIRELPQQYQALIGERGAMLSGGQRQRISIARAILRNPRILILDEATSALDYESERLIQDALIRLSAGRTVITIAHRLSTVRRADRIIVLREGRIMEQGTFDELRLRGGVFAEMLDAHTLEPHPG
jgi:ABC-type multidrug transport system fused ATPase/permease subunit